jgi:hypothetical protein
MLKMERLAEVKFAKVGFNSKASYESGTSGTQTGGKDGAGLVLVKRKQALETVSDRLPNPVFLWFIFSGSIRKFG